MALFDYIEVFYNHRRRHSTIGYVSPAVFERQARAARESVTVIEGVPFTGVLQSAAPDDRRSTSIL